MIDGDETYIMQCNKFINDEIGEATKKLCTSIDKSSDISSRVTLNYISAYKGLDGIRKSNKIRVLKTNRY